MNTIKVLLSIIGLFLLLPLILVLFFVVFGGAAGWSVSLMAIVFFAAMVKKNST